MTFTALARLLSAPSPKAPEPAAAPPPPPAPPAATRFVTARVKYRELLWHPVLGLAEDERLVVGAKAGLPHCAECDKPMSLGGRDWSCAACGRTAPGASVDLFTLDRVVAAGVQSYLRAKPGSAAVPALAAAAAL